MPDPVIVEITRGPRVESRHRVHVAVVDGDGAPVFSAGEPEMPVYPRSAIKLMQALPLVESGAAARYGFGDRELAMACASHSGEPAHIALVRSMLARAGLDETALACGTHWAFRRAVLIEQIRSGETPGPAFNNCSGKHSGFICTARHLGLDHHGYAGYDHPVQETVRDVLRTLTGAPAQAFGPAQCAIDGCSIPAYAMPLAGIAHGFARLATGHGVTRERAAAARRLFAACMAEPFYMAGTKRICSEIMTAGAGRIFIKTGAEGVFCAAIPEQGLGIALKAEDGSERASNAAISALLARFLRDDAALSAQVAARSRAIVKNWNGIETGLTSVLGV